MVKKTGDHAVRAEEDVWRDGEPEHHAILVCMSRLLSIPHYSTVWHSPWSNPIRMTRELL